MYSKDTLNDLYKPNNFQFIVNLNKIKMPKRPPGRYSFEICKSRKIFYKFVEDIQCKHKDGYFEFANQHEIVLKINNQKNANYVINVYDLTNDQEEVFVDEISIQCMQQLGKLVAEIKLNFQKQFIKIAKGKGSDEIISDWERIKKSLAEKNKKIMRYSLLGLELLFNFQITHQFDNLLSNCLQRKKKLLSKASLDSKGSKKSSKSKKVLEKNQILLENTQSPQIKDKQEELLPQLSTNIYPPAQYQEQKQEPLIQQIKTQEEIQKKQQPEITFEQAQQPEKISKQIQKSEQNIIIPAKKHSKLKSHLSDITQLSDDSSRHNTGQKNEKPENKLEEIPEELESISPTFNRKMSKTLHSRKNNQNIHKKFSLNHLPNQFLEETSDEKQKETDKKNNKTKYFLIVLIIFLLGVLGLSINPLKNSILSGMNKKRKTKGQKGKGK